MVHRHTLKFKAPTSSVGDDFSQITGIGSAIQTHLHNAGVLTFSQLSAATPERIAAIVPRISAKQITQEKWINQARKLAAKTAPVVSSKRETTREPRQHYATFMVELLLGVDNNVRRTRVTNVQTKSEESWSGWSEPRLSNFIAKCANLKRPEPAFAPEFPTSHGIAQSHEPPASSLQTTDVLYKERLADSKPKNFLCGTLKVGNLAVITSGTNTQQHVAHANETLNVQTLLDLTNVRTTPSTPLNCAIMIWAKRLGTGIRQIIGEKQIILMLEEKIPCIVESRIPSQGTYRLEALVTLTHVTTHRSQHSSIRAWCDGGILLVY